MTCPDNSKSLSVRRPAASLNCHLRLFKIVSLTRPRFGTLGPLPHRPEVLLRENDFCLTGEQNAQHSELFDCLSDFSHFHSDFDSSLGFVVRYLTVFLFFFPHSLDDTNSCKALLISTAPVPGPPGLSPALLQDPEGRSPVSPHPNLLLPITTHTTG